MRDLPIACTLTGAEQAERKALATVIAAGSMLGSAITERGATMRFDSAVEDDLRDLIAAESKCCAFLDFELSKEGDDLRLTVEGPDGARPIVLELFGLEPASG